MYWWLLIAVMNCFLESIFLTDMPVAMDSHTICSHHSNSVFIFHTSLSQYGMI
jgi:hypothetical protein